MTVTVKRLLKLGHAVSIESGLFIIRPKGKTPVPPEWMEEHSPALLREILMTLRIDAYQYDSYSTGCYGPTKISGLTLQLPAFVTDADTYTIFNAELNRERTTKTGSQGTPLPKGHFRITGKRHFFYRFWKSTGLGIPNRLASFHDYMGNLRGILFTANMMDGHRNRLDAGSIRPLSITATEIRIAFTPDSNHTIAGQFTDICRTILPDKEMARGQKKRGVQPKSSTCLENHGKAVNSTSGHMNTLDPSRKVPQEQSMEEWTDGFSHPADNDSIDWSTYERRV